MYVEVIRKTDAYLAGGEEMPATRECYRFSVSVQLGGRGVIQVRFAELVTYTGAPSKRGLKWTKAATYDARSGHDKEFKTAPELDDDLIAAAIRQAASRVEFVR